MTMATQRPGITDPKTRPLDVAMVLRRTLPAVFVDPVPVLGGLALLVVLPAIVTRLVVVGNDGETLLVILRALLAMLYAAMVAPIILARVHNRPIPIRAAIGRSTPGVQAALLLGAAVVAGMTLHLFARHGSVAGWLLDSLLLTAALLGASILMPLVPVAVIEALAPMMAIRRAAALTSGNRNRILALALLAGLTLAPLAALAFWVPGFWGMALFEGAAWLVAALLPALVYAGLMEGER